MTESMELAWDLVRRHPRSAARILEELPAADVASFLAATPATLASEALSKMTPPAAARVVAPLDSAVAATVLRDTAANVTASILRNLDETQRTQILDRMPARVGRAVRSILRHAEDTIGAWIDPQALVLPDDVTVDAAVQRVRESRNRRSVRLYVIDRNQRLRGSLDMRDLFCADRGMPVSALTRRLTRTLAAQTRLTAVLDHPDWNDEDELPIAGSDGTFLGVLRHVDLIRAVRTRFPETATSGFGDVAIEITADVWEGMSRFLETIAAVAAPAPRGPREERP